MKDPADDDDESEQFFESLDRISSTSGSEPDEDDYRHRHACHPMAEASYHLTTSASSYRVWISEPESVKERRRRLLLQMGLAEDRGLLRMNSGREGSLFRSPLHSSSSSSSSSLAANLVSNGTSLHCQLSVSPKGSTSTQLPVDFARSVSCEDSSTIPVSTSSIGRSSSDGNASTINRVLEGDLEVGAARGNYYSPDNLTTHEHRVLETPPVVSHLGDGRMPTGNGHRLRRQTSNSEVEGSLCALELREEEECLGDHLCKIKNLDNGKEFIVNEFKEDGMWNKLREVQTGRQLTMEEFEITVGRSPIVQELMRRECVESSGKNDGPECSINNTGPKKKKKGGWLKSMKVVANTVVTGHKERSSSDEKDTSSEKGGRRSSSATDDSQDVVFFSPKRTKVRYYGKSHKEFTALYSTQEIQAHNGSIWTIKFSLDGRYLASAGEDCVIHIWQVTEVERKGEILLEKSEEGNITPNFMGNSSPEPASVPTYLENHLEKKRRGKGSGNKKYSNTDHVVVPDNILMLSDKPICSFRGHLEDVLDLSWSKSQYLLSSSMDKTVRLWHMSSCTCLKMFSHSDYVTCIQFNPVDDRYFISGSLDAKVRIWSIPDRQVVDWSDLHEMVTAACYTPDGQCAFVGSHRGSCRIYRTSGNKLQQEKQITVLDKKKKSQGKKITGFQFPPGNSSEVLITSADSRIRIFDGVGLVHKFKGFRNTSSQIAASFAANGKFVICASEDSYVYVWRHEMMDCSTPAASSRNKSITRSYENFFCRDVSLAIPWPGNHLADKSINETAPENGGGASASFKSRAALSLSQLHIPPRLPAASFQSGGGGGGGGGLRSPMQKINDQESFLFRNRGSPLPSPHNSGPSNNFLCDRGTPTWPEEKLKAYDNRHEGSPVPSSRLNVGGASNDKVGTNGPNATAWGLVIVTAGLGGEIRTFQNFGLPVRT